MKDSLMADLNAHYPLSELIYNLELTDYENNLDNLILTARNNSYIDLKNATDRDFTNLNDEQELALFKGALTDLVELQLYCHDPIEINARKSEILNRVESLCPDLPGYTYPVFGISM